MRQVSCGCKVEVHGCIFKPWGLNVTKEWPEIIALSHFSRRRGVGGKPGKFALEKKVLLDLNNFRPNN
jgi:hypothetical protein